MLITLTIFINKGIIISRVVESGGKWWLMFTGEYHHNLDAKGRLIIPARFRENLDDEFVITRGLDGCLSLYANMEWKDLEDKLNLLPMTNKRARTLKRFLMGSACYCELDKQGRILIPQSLREKAELKKDVILLGVGDHIEIWNSEEWKENNEFFDSDELAEDMEGLGI